MPNEVKPISIAPEFVEVPCEKINELCRAIKPLMNLKAGSNMLITVSGTDITFQSSAGLPAGYTFEEFTICDSGTPATRWWPTWLTNPEA